MVVDLLDADQWIVGVSGVAQDGFHRQQAAPSCFVHGGGNMYCEMRGVAEVQELQQEVQNDFVKKLSPIIDQLAKEKGLDVVFNAGEAGIAWAAPGLDLTSDVIKKLDAAKPVAPPK